MAFPGSDTFDSYTSGNDLTTGAGGAGWGAAWTNSVGTAWKVSNTQSLNAPNSVIADAANNRTNERQLTSAISGTSTIVHVALFSDQMGVGGGADATMNFSIADGTEATAAFHFKLFMDEKNSKIQCQAEGGTNVDVLTSISANLWYHCYLDIDVTNKRCRGYASTAIPFSTPVFSSYSTSAGTPGTLNYVLIDTNKNTANVNLYLDDVRDVGSDFSSTSSGRRALLGVGQ